MVLPEVTNSDAAGAGCPPCACLALEHRCSLLGAGLCLWKGLVESSSKSGETEVQPQKLRFS